MMALFTAFRNAWVDNLAISTHFEMRGEQNHLDGVVVARQVAAGGMCILAVALGGAVYSWGRGGLGHGDQVTAGSDVPRQIDTLRGVPVTQVISQSMQQTWTALQ